MVHWGDHREGAWDSQAFGDDPPTKHVDLLGEGLDGRRHGSSCRQAPDTLFYVLPIANQIAHMRKLTHFIACIGIGLCLWTWVAGACQDHVYLARMQTCVLGGDVQGQQC